MLIRYVIAGGVNTLVGFIIYASAVQFIGAPYWLASLFSLVGSITLGLALSRFFVFPVSGVRLTEAWRRYVVAYGAQYGLAVVLIGMFMNFGLREIGAYIAAMPFLIALGYGAQRLWVFRPRQRAEPGAVHLLKD